MIEAPAISWEAAEYGSGNGSEAVALVAGFDGKTDTLDHAARDLTAAGCDVVVYQYAPEVLLDGQPEHLPNLIRTLSTDFQQRTADYPRRRYGGVSLGGAIAASMQKNEAFPEPGLYAATGIDAAALVMNNRLFRAMVRAIHRINIRRAFEANGHTLPGLQELWQDVHTPPTTAFTLALGGLDRIVRPREIIPIVTTWRKNNDGVRIISNPWLGHNGTIKWFNSNIRSMLEPEHS
jgi:hypothetical protein